ncbi:hypothetical protein BH23BAC1_BH23BAC1_09280 [soil metagenome]
MDFIQFLISLFTDQGLDATLVLGSAIKEIEEKLFYIKTDAEKIKLLDDFFLSHINHSFSLKCQLINSSIKIIQERSGNIAVTELTRLLNLNSRTFERNFLEQVGIFPKLYSKIFKLNHIIKLLQETNHPSLIDLTYQHGFYDQSHFIKNFKWFYGECPTMLDHSKPVEAFKIIESSCKPRSIYTTDQVSAPVEI